MGMNIHKKLKLGATEIKMIEYYYLKKETFAYKTTHN